MPNTMTRRQRFVLAAMAAAGGGKLAPVQVQKLFFLLDENIANRVGGRMFRFEPYNYGPFDASVYHELEALRAEGLIEISPEARGQRRYWLTPRGSVIGEREHRELPKDVGEYMSAVAKWVLSLSFSALVGAIYRTYPAMRENSIFVG